MLFQLEDITPCPIPMTLIKKFSFSFYSSFFLTNYVEYFSQRIGPQMFIQEAGGNAISLLQSLGMFHISLMYLCRHSLQLYSLFH